MASKKPAVRMATVGAELGRAEEYNAPGAALEKMMGYGESGAAIIDRHQIVLAALRISRKCRGPEEQSGLAPHQWRS